MVALNLRAAAPAAPVPGPTAGPPTIAGDRPWLHKWNVLETAIAFSIANNVVGDYLEFGVFRGASFIHAYDYRRYAFERYQRSQRRHLDDIFLTTPTRYFAFDSFVGLPDSDQDEIPLHWRGDGAMACSEPAFLENLRSGGVDLASVVTVPGFYEQSLTSTTAESIGLHRAAVVNIDCDLGPSTVPVLEFLEPLIVDGTVLIFDDWFYYRGRPDKGERGAFEAWLDRNPRFVASELSRVYPTAAFILNERTPTG